MDNSFVITLSGCPSLKKVILGTGLIICGIFGVLTSIIIETILFASPNHISQGGGDPFFYYSIAVLIIGILLNIWGFMENNKP